MVNEYDDKVVATDTTDLSRQGLLVSISAKYNAM